MYVHVAPRKSIHFREIFVWAFTDGLTTFVNMWLCSRQALNFCPINFYYFTVWCLQSLCHLKRKLFESTIMPVEVFISIVKDWYKMTCFWPCAFTIKRSVQTHRLNTMYPRTKQQTHDKGSMVRAQYCSELTDLGYGMALLFNSLVPRWLMKAQPLLCVAI